MLGITVEYVAGVAHLDRQAYDEPGHVEWPPHPDRLFMALVAAMYRGEPQPAELEALSWLEGQQPPAISASPTNDRSTLTAYWPTNDKLYANRNKEKLLAATCPDDPCVTYWWDEKPKEELLEALRNVTSRMTYLGRSESIVNCWVEEGKRTAAWIPDDQGVLKMRVPYQGRLSELQAFYAAGNRPQPAAWHGYRNTHSPETIQGEWSQLIPLELGKPVDLRQVCPLIEAVRKCFLAACEEPMPSWLSGHTKNGDRLQASHVGLVPLADVGNPYSSGIVYGVGLMIPKSIDAVAASLALAPFLEKTSWIDAKTSIGKVESLRKTVFADTWCRASKTWGTVTPILLPRWPKQESVDSLLLKAIEQAELPVPESIEILQSSPHRGGLGMELVSPPNRYRLHATIKWQSSLAGPVAIGSGRYKGLGFCKAIL
ncbi:CRISPR-associated protein, family (Cas_GSU0054) [Bythopirellula goksoeyrii]|uniref:CRISPR-associated protein, family (Cas_GSU0054) n=1 Tax=Bythopirellula goksoeyrii TaxID=1400387 RepID=A0A5B9Q883_9BACT|nr:CRISPR-associated protein, family (Cas_GSU0054) [Bythopirellula goksoeyrii]